MQTVNLVACAIMWLGTFWALLTPKVPSCVGGAVFLWALNLALLGDMAQSGSCHDNSEVVVNIAFACLTLWVIWLVELQPRPKGRAAA